MGEKDTLKVVSIFRTIQGEATDMGFPSVFVRLYGCNLNCSYCDTIQEKGKYDDISVDAIVSRVKTYSLRRVCITGGEPLLQENTNELCKKLASSGLMVSVETNGSLPLLSYNERRNFLRGSGSWTYSMDIKLPSAGENEYTKGLNMLWKNISRLYGGDCIKFVVSDIQDISKAISIIKDIVVFQNTKLLGLSSPQIFISPVDNGGIQTDIAKQAVEIIMEMERIHGISIRLQTQLHKTIGIL